MDEWDDPFVTAQGLPQWPAADLHRVTLTALVTKSITELLAIMTTSVGMLDTLSKEWMCVRTTTCAYTVSITGSTVTVVVFVAVSCRNKTRLHCTRRATHTIVQQ